MARPAKSLAEHLRDGSFRARRHHELLAGPLVPARKLRELQVGYQAASTERERRSYALDFQQAQRVEAASETKSEEAPATSGTRKDRSPDSRSCWSPGRARS